MTAGRPYLGFDLLSLPIGRASATGEMPIAGAAHVGGCMAGMALLRPLPVWRWRGGRASIA